jgi:RIO kinase 1
VRRPLLFRRAHAGVRLRRLDAAGQCGKLRPQRLDLPLLPEDHIAQFGIRALQEGDLGLYLLESMNGHDEGSSTAACYTSAVRALERFSRTPSPTSFAGRKTAATQTMKVPKGLQPLIDDGVIDEVIRALKSGKEATVYVVRSGTHLRCAKVYRDLAQRSFQRRAQYQEGRKVRGSRETRAMNRGTRFGRREQEHEWKNAEVDALYRLVAADVRVPRPFGYFNDVLIMELVRDASGDPAPRLGEVELTADLAREYHGFLMQQIARMLSLGLIHGDLSEFNILLSPEGPVIIDLPQAVNASGNNAAFAMLERDINNIRATLGRFAPELLQTEFAREMWALYEQGELRPDSRLTGMIFRDEAPVDTGEVIQVIEEAREEAIRRRLGREDQVG